MALKNFSAEQPHQHALYYTTFLLEELAWHKDELLDAMEGNFYLALTQPYTCFNIRELKQRRRGRKRKRQKEICLDQQNNNSARASCFLYIYLPSLLDYDVKIPNFTLANCTIYTSMSYLIRRVLAKPRLISDEMCHLYGKLASYLRRVLCKTRPYFSSYKWPYFVEEENTRRRLSFSFHEL